MDDKLHVVCLCAAWCGVCRDYRAVLDEIATRFAGRAAFRWIDIEDEAELLGDIDVDNFPTLLIARDGRALFFGTITPQPATLERLVQGALGDELAPVAAGPELDNLLRRLRDDA
jgi:thioredoxin-like negative regulator of GroEL